MDKALNVYAHRLLMSVILYQNAVMNGDVTKAKSLQGEIPESQYGKLAKFLEANGQAEMAFEMTPDLDHKFDLALGLNRVDAAFRIAESSGNSEKWRKVGDIALARGQFTMAESCYDKSDDFNSLLLFYSSYGDF